MKYVLDDGDIVHWSTRPIGSRDGIAEIDPEAFNDATSRDFALFILGQDCFCSMRLHHCYAVPSDTHELNLVSTPAGAVVTVGEQQ